MMIDLGLLPSYLEIEITQESERIKLSQRSYASRILEQNGMLECNIVYTHQRADVSFEKNQAYKLYNILKLNGKSTIGMTFFSGNNLIC